MVERPVVILSIDDRERAEDIAVELAEAGFTVISEDEPDTGMAADLMISDSGVRNDRTAHLLIGGTEIAGNGPGRLSASASPEIVAAAALLMLEGYAIAPIRTPDDSGEAAPSDTRADTLHLTAREKQVLALLTDGAPNKAIARALDISVHTAKFHVAALLQKLGAKNRTDAIVIAIRDGHVMY